MLKDKEFVNFESETDEIKDSFINEIDEKKQIMFSVDQEVKVTPTGITDYGVFCKCENEWNGLVHISKITTDFVQSVSDYFTIGKPFKAKILGIDKEKRQLKLSTIDFNLKPENKINNKKIS